MSDENEYLDIEDQICHRFYQVSNRVMRIYRPLLSQLNITYPQYLALLVLWKQKKVTMGELANQTQIDKGFLSTLIKKMEANSLIKISDDVLDARIKNITLTPKGISLREKAVDIPMDFFCKLKLSKKDATQLKESLDTLILKMDD